MPFSARENVSIKYIIQGHADDDRDSIYAKDETRFFDTPEEAEAAITELCKSGPDLANADLRMAEFDHPNPVFWGPR